MNAKSFLTVFNEARNNRESFFSCSQRLTDMSKTVRAKQIQVLGRLNAEDITPNLRRLEKQYKISFAEMPSEIGSIMEKCLEAQSLSRS